VLVRPEDILSAVRSAILLGAVVPGLREEVESLSADLAELVRLRELGNSNRETLARELELLRGESERLDALTRLRREQLLQAEASLANQRSRAAMLGAEARNTKELVDRLDAELGTARRDAEAERRRAETEARQVRERFAAAASRDPVRLAPKVPFAEARGSLAKPVTGPVLKEFGAPDGQGGTLRGIVIAARSKGLVTAPADGSVSYAGPFRSFGRLLIINAGDGYYLLLAGMDQISVETGQFVLAGEPVGQMGETSSPAAALSAVEGSGPALYVEFRKDGSSIDPRPWWARSQSERVRG
jgi:septal ring factor EnvC (AmiA/AmiB activator)